MNPIIRNIILGILCYLSFMVGTALTLNTFRLIFHYSSMFSDIFKWSFYPTLITYIILFASLYIKPKFFNKLYYFLAILLSLYMYNLWAFLIYIILNLFIKFGTMFNLIIFLGFGLGITIHGIINDRHTQFDEQTIYCSKLSRDEKVTIIHLTDLHLGACYDETFVQMIIEKIINYTKERKIDFVVITGDLVDGNIRLTKEMLEPFQLIKCPIYYVSGNHEDYTWKKEAFDLIESQSNLIHLSNDSKIFENKFNIIGVDYNFSSGISINNLKNLLERCTNDLPNIFLYHTPLLNLNELKAYNIFLLLCGHMHGGQFFPFSLLRYCLKNKFVIEGLYKDDNIDGIYSENYIYCCSGTGTQGPCTRTFVPPYIGIINIEGKS